ncbi:nuclease SbcCD subunit D [Kocuria varians]|uniref:Nuclease SbcCD subunit D n=2 Tax=Kocuria varians TaxID=1272 RepID=A0A4Y4D698_KOCVA|nr:nuclease SbcCD subunit D [Kocuria varians]
MPVGGLSYSERMLILHTSDWHLGRTFHGVDILDVQARAMAEIVAWVREHGVDVVLVSGDVYDRAQPRTEVVELLNTTLAQLRGAGAYVVLTSGNHDSPARLGFGSQIMAHGGVFLLTAVDGAARPVLFAESGAGDISAVRALPSDAGRPSPSADEAPTLAVYGIPYLEPRATAPLLDCPPTHQAVMGAVMSEIDADRVARGGPTSVVMAHAFVTGAQATDSERIVDSGGLGTVSADVFAAHDYAALGHIHRRQRITETARYSGSPVAYSFSEATHPKGAWLVRADAAGLGDVVPLDHRAGLRLARLRGPLETLVSDPELTAEEDAWCQVVLTDAERPASAMDRVRSRFPRTVELRWEPEGGRTVAQRAYSAQLEEAASTEELCARFYEHVRFRALTEEECTEISEAVSAVQSRGVEQ